MALGIIILSRMAYRMIELIRITFSTMPLSIMTSNKMISMVMALRMSLTMLTLNNITPSKLAFNIMTLYRIASKLFGKMAS